MVTEILSHAEKTIQQTTSITIDWNEVCLLAIGAGIGLIVSCITMIIQNFVDQAGSLRIFYRITNDNGATVRGWGLSKTTDNRVYLSIPLMFEFQNTSNSVRAFRDVSLLLYQDNLFVAKMGQIGHMKVTTQTNGVLTKESDYCYGGEKESYSFVLEPHSIQRKECRFLYFVNQEKAFNRIVARYYDEKNRPQQFLLRKICSTEVKRLEPDEDWILLNDSRIRRKLK